jgi:hypothetical protein
MIGLKKARSALDAFFNQEKTDVFSSLPNLTQISDRSWHIFYNGFTLDFLRASISASLRGALQCLVWFGFML